MRRGTKKLLVVITAVFLLGLLCSCSNDKGDNTGRKKSTTKATSTPKATVSEAPKATPTPGTAKKPAALNKQDIVHATGVMDSYFDPETGKYFEVIEDAGEDGSSRTMNCFDDEGKLVWWESYAYDSDYRVSEIIRREPVNNNLISRKVLYYNGDDIERMNLYEAGPVKSGKQEEFKVLEETYYLGGALHTKVTYYPYPEIKRYTPKERFEYAEDKSETYHALYLQNGDVDEEYINGEKVFRVPDTVTEMFTVLNEATDEDFENIWRSCEKKIEQNSLKEDWESLCIVFSGYHDSYGTAVTRLRDEYGLKLFATKSSGASFYKDDTVSYKSILKYIEDEKVNPLLFKKVYREGCYPELGGTLWLPAEYKEATKSGKKTVRSNDGLIRILVVDHSKTIWSDTISRDLLLEDTKYSERMIERAETILKGLFTSVSGKICFTSYPELADVVFEIRSEYPFAGQYKYTNGTIANVYNHSMSVTAINQRGKGEASAKFENIAGSKVSTKGGTNIFMRVPDVTKEEYRSQAEKFTETVMSWFE